MPSALLIIDVQSDLCSGDYACFGCPQNSEKIVR